MKVLFLQTAHTENDDRVRYHQCMSLQEAGHQCAFASEVNDFHCEADVIICDTPLAIRRARKAFGYRKPVIYDITEWYPSKKNLRNEALWFRPFKFCIMVIANIWAACASTAYIFGEYHKSIPFRMFFPWKRSLWTPYYPSLQYVRSVAPRDLSNEVRLFYAGPKSKEKGFERVQRVVQLCQERLPDKIIKLTTIENVAYNVFCEEIAKHDIFLDLRDNDIENTRCLPIKLFYYMAVGRPVIYTNLKAIRRGVPEIVEDSLIAPNDIERAADIICDYTNNSQLYKRICIRNRQLVENKYNWESLRNNFVHFIEHI